MTSTDSELCEIDHQLTREKKVFWSQKLASVTLSLALLVVGLSNGWTSPYLAQLALKENVDGIPRADPEEVSWIASLINVGRIFGVIAAAIVQETFGCKMSLYLSGLPMMAGWICTAVAVSVYWLYAARLLCGFAMGMVWTSLSLYLAEIADPEIRGSLVLWNITMHSVGLFLGDLMGPYVSLHIFACICLVPNVLFLFLFPLIPDSPHWHIMQNDLDQAETSLKWFRRREDVKQELFELWDYVSTSKISLRERIKELKDSKYRHSFLLMFLINIFSYFGAHNVISSYMEIILTNSQVDVTASTIVTIAGFLTIISGTLATILVDNFGRRFLLIVSSSGMALALTSLGLHFKLLSMGYDTKAITWLPCSCLLVYLTSYWAGCGSIPSTLVGELFSPKLKTIATLSFNITSAIFSSLSTATFLPILGFAEAHWLFWFYSSGIYVSIVYYYLYLPETMGKSLKDIQK